MENVKTTGIEKLKDLVEIQSADGNWDYSQYMRGMANGLILALAIMEGKEPVYKEDIKQYLEEKDDGKECENFKEHGVHIINTVTKNRDCCNSTPLSSSESDLEKGLGLTDKK